ncbi:cyclic nucleotide-binding domain-containing protein [Listeria booriae]|uniref:cyclic nucleotide-binding domain-containing protein n=1 Tax=Listeria booriae TaxID=1552123 RepID=UPI00162A671C|nr:Crp/Fnr family transcriptional regulator [Listeria booriae]MBC2324166.1 Crp/Fnr family transcriptional regulator [Listeria booriae]MBC2327825.1 Crp/Fnr family transcriptional regulator [Listeria booriae]MCD2208027.1 Crp/Fnr family transcriptional regulator [Listeria booriae]
MDQSICIESIYNNEQAKRYFLEDPTYKIVYEKKQIQPGEIIVAELSKCENIFIIESGVIQETKNGECVNLLGPNTFIGIDSIFNLSKIAATTFTAITTTDIYKVSMKSIIKKINDRRESQIFLVSLMRNYSMSQLAHLSFLNKTKKNILPILIELGSILGTKNDIKICFPAGLTKKQIADYLNLSDTVIANCWTKLQKKGVLEEIEGSIIIYI